MHTLDFLGLLGLPEGEARMKLSVVLNRDEFPESDEDGLSLKSEGITIFLDQNKLVEQVAFFAGDTDQKMFSGLLPNGINFNDSAECVEEKCGEPSWRSKGRFSFKQHDISVPKSFFSFFVVYYFNNYSWNFAFNEDNQLIRLSISHGIPDHLKNYPNFSVEYLDHNIVRN